MGCAFFALRAHAGVVAFEARTVGCVCLCGSHLSFVLVSTHDRATVDALTRRLRGEGLAVAAYHAALPAAGRAEVLQQWRAGQLQAVVASVAFGMGVDKGGWHSAVALSFAHTTVLSCWTSAQLVQGANNCLALSLRISTAQHARLQLSIIVRHRRIESSYMSAQGHQGCRCSCCA